VQVGDKRGAIVTDTLKDDVRALRAELELLNQHKFIQMHNKPIKLLAFNFARGLVFGLGTFLGASLLLSMAAWALSQIDFIPIIGEWAKMIAGELRTVAEQPQQ